MATVYAQPSPPPNEVDVVYFKDGGVLRGEIVGRSAKTGKIQLRDGSVFVYRKSDVRMTVKESLQVSEQSAKEDSIKIAGIAKKVWAEETEKRRADEELKALQHLVNANAEAYSDMPDDNHKPARLYSMIEAGIGAGFGDMPSPQNQSALSSIANTHKLVTMRYAVGGRGDYFGMGLSLGVQQQRKSSAFVSLADSSGGTRYEVDSTLSHLLFFPVGLDMRLELLPDTPVSPFIAATAAYAISLNTGKDRDADNFFILNPSVGLRFGGAVSSLLSVGLQVHIEPGGNELHFVTLRFGLIF
jgi:gas vesicle protein